MHANEIMTKNPTCCTPDMNLQEAARMMMDCNCGALPVVESKDSMKLIGMITDRDITCRTIALGKNPMQMHVMDAMTTPIVCISENADLSECLNEMEMNQVRRMPVIDDRGCCCGIIAQADIARACPAHDTADLVQKVSGDMSANSQLTI